MHIHILGICGTFMGGIALLAKELGYEVSGSDTNVYPPMSTQLEQAGISLSSLDDMAQFQPKPDLVVIGNAMSRGKTVVEHVLNNNLPYTSGPEFLADYLLKNRWVLAVSGTHGKTTTSSMLAWILEYAGLKPGFLIGGVPENFGLSARSGSEPFFVVEADEYDTAFFDKRSKFVHYKPRTLIMNNLEFDHADIFPDLDAIKKQFHHLVRTVPGNGLIVYPEAETHLQEVIDMGCWTPCETYAQSHSATAQWTLNNIKEDGSQFDVLVNGQCQGTVAWPLIGMHNVNNAIMAIAAARHAGVPCGSAIEALSHFQNVKRRMEVIGEAHGITVYDDFAHHPTAIQSTLDGLRNKVGNRRIIAVLEPRSNTMRMGVHKDTLAGSLELADEILLYQPPELDWNLTEVVARLSGKARLFNSIESIIEHIVESAKSGDQVLIMSNGGFGGLHKKLLQRLEQLEPQS
ncbi:MAG: UDP-N-acetylmuramate:L-alanyl-gamma-D-glutamyl-meso-diaminopimelate ligase [Gammaproteobacteria bacterium]|nr:UDP-N-acetylmuramate:L-alanyl-gamma-D-glutamyl-meso-diaminopimelate ligase [Gammaproteobacteria bacterium]MDH5802433.1 UDP-N-acetylmuramate:L-alanyl-gamma-D-glutamyl-meso-diaminopimelate ligase [Gammaproteobacteria bacterium]